MPHDKIENEGFTQVKGDAPKAWKEDEACVQGQPCKADVYPSLSHEVGRESAILRKRKAENYLDPYHSDTQNHKFHAILNNKTIGRGDGDKVLFVSALTEADLNVALEQYDLGSILAIYQGQRVAFTEKRNVSLNPFQVS